MSRPIGICSRCGGHVTLPEAWLGLTPPHPTCERCGARARSANQLPTIEMEADDRQAFDDAFDRAVRAARRVLSERAP